MNSRLVNVQTIIPNLIIDLKYATSDNFTKKVVYSSSQCYLIDAVAQALKNTTHDFNSLGYCIKIWDGYRPLQAQYTFWQLVPDPNYVADPKQGSRHNRGCAVDVTLVDQNGQELDMGTGFDDFTIKAHRDYQNFSDQALKNRQILQTVMEKHGFIGWHEEWWHFDFKDWEQHPVLDIPFEDLER